MTYPPPWNPGQTGSPNDPWRSGYQPPAGSDPFVVGPPPGQAWPGQYEQLPGYPSPGGEPPRRDNTQWVIVGIAAMLVLAIAFTGLVWAFSRDNNSDPIATSTTAGVTTSYVTSATSTPRSTTTTATTAPAPAPQTGGCEGKATGPAPGTPADWKTVVGKRGLAYDVPPDWEVLTCDTQVGWEKKCSDGPFGYCPVRLMNGAAQLHDASCQKPTGAISVTGTAGASNRTDIRQAVKDEAGLVKDIWTADDAPPVTVSLTRPRDLTVGGAPAVEVVATVTNIVDESCGATSALHVMVATTVPGQPGSVVFIAALGFHGAPDTGLADKLVASVRRTT